MDKYINKIIRGFKKIFNKKYFAIVSIFIGITAVLGFTYGYLSYESDWNLAAQLRIRKLFYSMKVNGTTTSDIVVQANSGTTYYNVEITSLNDINTKYVLSYKVIGTATVKISSSSTNSGVGIIGLYSTGANTEKKKTVRIAVTNNSSSTATVLLKVSGGYTWNSSSQVSLDTGYSIVSGIHKEYAYNAGLTLSEELSALLNCTPTASSPCYYTNNSNNYLSYAGHTWRIMGVFLVNGTPVVKLILKEQLSTKVTYANTSSALSSFYNGLSNTSLIQGTPTSITNAEYEAIGGVNSYLYTKPEKDYWTSTQYYVGTSRGAVNKSSSSTAYIRPVITLTPLVVNTSTGEVGTSTNPYVIAQGVMVTVNNLLYGTTDFTSGYYGVGHTYTVSRPVSTDPDIAFGSWTVTGTGSSISGTTLTVGTTDTTLTANWVIKKTVTYNCNGGTGTAPAQAKVEEGDYADLTPRCTGYKITTGTSGSIKYQTGWSTTSTGSAASQVQVNDNITLYAVYGSNLLTYSGTYNVISDGNSNWRVELKGTGTLTFNKATSIDIHVTGGGGGGGGNNENDSYGGGGGGGGGATKIVTSGYNASGSISVTIGGGGAGGVGVRGGSAGGTSSFGSLVTAGGGSGGARGYYYTAGGGSLGGDGGTGGSSTGGSLTASSSANGAAGGKGGNKGYTGSTGGNGNAYPFGSSSNGSTRYGAGGGGGGGNTSGGAGGTTGGGRGGPSKSSNGVAGTANTGSGGGGASGGTGGDHSGGAGGSGIVIIRNHR